MVREHRSGPRFRARFDDDAPGPAPDAGPATDPWGQRFRAALRRAGVTVPRHPPPGVEDLAVVAGAITAVVAGDGRDDEPYRVRVGLHPLPAEVWDAAADRLAADAWSAAAVALGRVPETLVAAVADAGGELLPRSEGVLPMDCTCADWAMPCTHVAAVLAHAAARFATDPFALVRWRGRERRELREAVRDRRAARGPAAAAAELVGRWYAPGAPVPAPTGRPTRPDALLDDLPPLGGDADPVDDDGRRVDAREALRPLYRRLAADRARSR